MGGFRRKFRRQATRAGGGLRRRMVDDHIDVLQNIEFTMANCAREDQRIDDAAVKDALESALLARPSANPLAQDLMDALRAIRETWEDIPDDVWADGLRVVLESVRLHSSLEPGARGYLDFVSPYVP